MIVNCKRCGRIFQKSTRDICPSCISEQHELVETIRTYLKQNLTATITDVVRDTDVPLEIILDFIDDGLLIFVDNSNISFECSHCGGLSNEGRVCTKCKNELIHELANATQLVQKVRKPTETQSVMYHAMNRTR